MLRFFLIVETIFYTFLVKISVKKIMKIKVEGFVSGNRVPLDSSHESMDLYHIMITNPDSKKVCKSESLLFGKDSVSGFNL